MEYITKIVLLELTVPLDNVHLAHDRITSKYSALVTACEESGFKTHMFALEVGCLGYCPHSFLHCFEALRLPNRQRVRSDPRRQKPPFAHRMYFFFAEACRLGGVKLFFTEPCSCRFVFPFFFFVFICFAISVSHRSHSETTRSVSKHTRNTPSLFDFSNCQTYTVLNAYSSFSRTSFRNKLQSSQSVALCLFFVTWTQRCVCGSSIGGSLLICSWLL